MSHTSSPQSRSSALAPRVAAHCTLAALLAGLASCADPTLSAAPSSSTDTGSSTTSTSTTAEPTPTTADPTTTSSPTSSTTDALTTYASTTYASTSTDPTTDATGPIGCTKNVVLMGYWPPSNEMLRPWSDDPTKNPDGWIGADWGGYGYDVHAFFPEFPPDGDPTNDDLGDDGAVGSPEHDLRVDYQATSEDFWRLVDTYQPVILVTTSRGGALGWELEALEGGHGLGNPDDPAYDWVSDQYGVDHFPTQETIEPRSWDAITTYRQGQTLPSQLPLDAILAATEPLGLTTVAIDQGTSGNFLSGFLGLHGLYYHELAPHNVAAGHIHVGYGLPLADARALVEATLHAVLQAHPADSVDCP